MMVRICHQQHEFMTPTCLVSTFQAAAGGGGIMLWGMFSQYKSSMFRMLKHVWVWTLTTSTMITRHVTKHKVVTKCTSSTSVFSDCGWTITQSILFRKLRGPLTKKWPIFRSIRHKLSDSYSYIRILTDNHRGLQVQSYYGRGPGTDCGKNK